MTDRSISLWGLLNASRTHLNGSERFCGSGRSSIRWKRASKTGRRLPWAPAIRSNWIAVKYTQRASAPSRPGRVKNPRFSLSIMWIASLYENFLSMLTRPGEPSEAARLGQNVFHKNAVKCGELWTSFGSEEVSVKILSMKKSELGCFFEGVETVPGSMSLLHSHCMTGITSL